jgi:DNA-binding winged helix-turn-helix (wHTH) protein
MYAFGAFELDPLSHELRRGGVRIKVQDQPFTVLVKLLERPGQLVTREELRSALWTGDTFVDFDTSLNSAIKRLREALGDSAEAPAFIETLPKLGYRFVAPVEVRSPAPLRAPDKAESQSQPDKDGRRVSWPLWAVAAAVLLAGVTVLFFYARSRVAAPALAMEVVPLTGIDQTEGDRFFARWQSRRIRGFGRTRGSRWHLHHGDWRRKASTSYRGFARLLPKMVA